MKICICDDDKNIVVFIKDILEKYSVKNKISLDIVCFYDSTTLLDYLKFNNTDLIYLDIQMDNIDGIQIGNFIRNTLKNNKIQIVYISSISDYSMYLFPIRPNNFLIKPLSENKIIENLDIAINLLNEKNYLFRYKIDTDYYIQNIYDIIYFESDNHKIKMYAKSFENSFYGNLSKLYTKFEKHNFAFCHRSFLVNLNHIIKFSKNEITMSNNKLLTISRSKKDEFMKAIMKFDSK